MPKLHRLPIVSLMCLAQFGGLGPPAQAVWPSNRFTNRLGNAPRRHHMGQFKIYESTARVLEVLVDHAHEPLVAKEVCRLTGGRDGDPPPLPLNVVQPILGRFADDDEGGWLQVTDHPTITYKDFRSQEIRPSKQYQLRDDVAVQWAKGRLEIARSLGAVKRRRRRFVPRPTVVTPASNRI